MQIGNIRLSAPVALAPMAGITDMPFRIICKELGCGLVVELLHRGHAQRADLPGLSCAGPLLSSFHRHDSFTSLVKGQNGSSPSSSLSSANGSPDGVP